MKTFLFFLSIILQVNSHLAAQTLKLNLKQSVELGLSYSNELKIFDSKVQSNKAKVKEITSQFFAPVKFNASYSRLSNVDPFRITVPFSNSLIQIADVLLNNYSFNLSLRQPIFTGFRLSSQRNSAELIRKSSEFEYDYEKNNLAYDIQAAFLNYYKSQLIKEVADENVVQNELHVNNTRNFLINGLATKSDLLKFEVQNSNAKLEQLEAANNIQLARMFFNKLIGFKLETMTELEIDKLEIIPVEYNLTALINESIEKRSELKSLNFKIRAAQENITAAKSSYYPSVYLLGSYNYANPNTRVQPPKNKFTGTWDAGILLSWDLWNWGNTSAQVTQQEQLMFQSQTSYDELKNAIVLEVNQSYLNLTYLKEKIEVNKKIIEQSDENYRVTKEKYNVQYASSTEVIDAEISLFQAKTNYTNAIVDYQIALLNLYKSIGRKLY